jgi:hypothetical protein
MGEALRRGNMRDLRFAFEEFLFSFGTPLFGTILLGIDVWISVYLSVCLVVFNVYFLLLSESPLNAILKSVALAFIYQMDVTMNPKWGEDQTAEVKADFVYNYITLPL